MKLLMRKVKVIRYYPERIPPNPRNFDSKKVRAATVKINKVVSLIKAKTITETYSLIRAVRNIVADGGLQKQDDRKQTTKLTKNFKEFYRSREYYRKS